MTDENAAAPVNCELYALELRTQQWAALVQWYRHALGLRSLVRVDEDEYALLAAGAARLSIVGRPEVEPASTRQLLIFEVDDLAAAIERLQAAGVEFLKSADVESRIRVTQRVQALPKALVVVEDAP